MAKVNIQESGPTAGVWATCDDGSCVGLVAQDGVGPYLCLYPPKPSGLPALAIAVTGGDTVIQVPGDDRKPQVVTLTDIVKAMRQLSALE